MFAQRQLPPSTKIVTNNASVTFDSTKFRGGQSVVSNGITISSGNSSTFANSPYIFASKDSLIFTIGNNVNGISKIQFSTSQAAFIKDNSVIKQGTIDTSGGVFTWTANDGVYTGNQIKLTNNDTNAINFTSITVEYYIQYEVTPQSEDINKGTVSGGGPVCEGTYTTVNATPNTGYSFAGWYENEEKVSDSPSYTFIVNSKVTLLAKFTLNSYVISVTSEDTNKGTVSGGGTFNHGESITVEATSNTGYSFLGWFENDEKVPEAESTYTFIVSKARDLTAKFKANSYNIIYKDKDGADFSGVHEQGYPVTHTYGVATSLKGATKSGYTFIGWYKEADCSGNRVETMGANEYLKDITLYAKWEKQTNIIPIVVGASIGGAGVIGASAFFIIKSYKKKKLLNANKSEKE